MLNGIHKAAADKDSELLRRMSHTLKSTSQDFGAVELAKLGEKLEALSKMGNLGDVSELVQQADRQYASVDRAMKVIRAGGNNAG